ncbi:prephenate dehydrogenase dimerization domain-containing protein, partial [Microbispora sp. NPDC049633]|uniref:prephenate dehydrogenase dimerization domain-containing protein n=1 Tax=Microbispora sp. NPDC049633 TaxID=3154355 RepID=UPI0034210740
VVSHAPHVTAAAVAARLAEASETALGLSGQGVRDVTRIAASDPSLWTGILEGNALPVAEVLEALVADLSAAARSLRALAGDGAAMEQVTDLLARGVRGTGRIPGKHGGPARTYAVVQVLIGDRPGELARLVQAAGETGVNIEDIRLEHATGLELGAAELYVRPEAAETLTEGLRERGWQVPA